MRASVFSLQIVFLIYLMFFEGRREMRLSSVVGKIEPIRRDFIIKSRLDRIKTWVRDGAGWKSFVSIGVVGGIVSKILHSQLKGGLPQKMLKCRVHLKWHSFVDALPQNARNSALHIIVACLLFNKR